MMNSLAAAAFVLLLSGSAIAQQQPQQKSKSSGSTSKTGTRSSTDAVRSDPSAANTHDGTMGISTGTGTTAEQAQVSGAGGARTTTTDPTSSVKTSAPNVKAKKKAPKSSNQ
ncbi:MULTISPECIES: hypothetical protein [Spirosoma]|uniref:Proteophosphoglycan ppg4 n=1 Tax=Spirosoma liriopis TaxID=2937440 RepID=A0ABT0HKG1_9BACT|nr:MULTISPECIES: hypothetical protein [Spirosoma]MCK8492633.1 hypothetical protein [Spirosoma liriopis]UHG92101.1 hypothetical protein LQ777_04150 [Spirosoma oryzicola]